MLVLVGRARENFKLSLHNWIVLYLLEFNLIPYIKNAVAGLAKNLAMARQQCDQIQ
jgi:hypothetical protein